MPTPRIGTIVVIALCAVLTASARQPSPAWPPPLQPADPDAGPRSAEEALKTFFLPPGYRLEIVASEPLVEDPVWIDMDADGRLWVVEMRGYMIDAEASREREPVGRVTVLEDTNDDGRMDRRTVFLDGLVLPRTIEVLDRGVLVVEPPRVWLARDTNGDLKADVKHVVADNFGRALGNPEHNANSLMWGLDNWLHTSEHDRQLRIRNGAVEQRATLLRGQWGVSMDDAGRIYRNWNEQPLFVDLVAAHYFVRNPNLVRTRGAYEPATLDATVWPVRPTRGVNRGYREGTLRPDGTLAVFNSAGSPIVYRGDRLPSELRGNVFVTEPAGNLVRRFVVREDAQGAIDASNPYPRAEFLTSTDERFRPVNLYSAPDGTLYIVDMYRGIIQHRQYQSEYLRNYIRTHRLAAPIRYGRIYRLVHESTRRDAKPSLSTETPAQLVERLAHANGWWRDTAQRLLVERGDRGVAPRLAERASSAPDFRTRLHALWTLDGLGAIDVATVQRSLDDASPFVRAAAVRLAERFLGEPGAVATDVMKRLDDPDAAVRRQVAATIGELPDGVRELALGLALERYGTDPVVVDAVISGARGRELVLVERLLQAKLARPEAATDALSSLAGAIVKSRQAAAIQMLLTRAADASRLPAHRVALLRGAASGLPGANRAAVLLAEETGRGLGAPVLLARQPDALVTLSASSDAETRATATALLAAFAWPGKPRAQRAVVPLSPPETKRFEAGREIYGNLCAACHQADGGGLTGLAPPLIGSQWVTGRAGLTARILLHGKEGQALMPPLGSSLSDEQIAGVLTYVRRSWGHTASAVDTSLVREVRGASTGRDRPWTEPELMKVTQPDGPPGRP